MEVSGQPYAPVALAPGKQLPVTNGWEVGWALTPVRTLQKRDNSLAPARNGATTPRQSSPVGSVSLYRPGFQMGNKEQRRGRERLCLPTNSLLNATWAKRLVYSPLTFNWRLQRSDGAIWNYYTSASVDRLRH
jgi:hypothetical protein